MRKTLYTLNLGNMYAPEVCDLTYPLLRYYAHKIGAEFFIITEDKFPGWPNRYNKLQIYQLAQEREDEWSIFVDSDTLIHPEMWDPTNHLPRNTVAHNGNDMAGNRFRYDRFFRRDDRHIGSCTWFIIASDWCIDLFKPLDDLTFEEAIANIFPTPSEQAPYQFALDQKGDRIRDGNGDPIKVLKTPIDPAHLIDDYTLSRNIAKFGLKFDTIMKIQERLKDPGNYLWHAYTVNPPEKAKQILAVLKSWALDLFLKQHEKMIEDLKASDIWQREEVQCS